MRVFSKRERERERDDGDVWAEVEGRWKGVEGRNATEKWRDAREEEEEDGEDMCGGSGGGVVGVDACGDDGTRQKTRGRWEECGRT